MRVGSELTLLTHNRFLDLHASWQINRYTREYYIDAGGVHTTLNYKKYIFLSIPCSSLLNNDNVVEYFEKTRISMSNKPAEQYLSDYFDLDMSPHYAVMLTCYVPHLTDVDFE